MKHKLVRQLQAIFGFRVLIVWGSYQTIHYAWTKLDALDWTNQYPVDSISWVLLDGGKVVEVNVINQCD